MDQNDWYQSGTQTCLTITHSWGALGPCERMGGWIWRLIGQSVDRGLDRRHFTLGAISNRYSLSLLLQPLMSLPRNWSPWQTTCRYRSAIVPCGGAAAVVVQKQSCQQSHTLARLEWYRPRILLLIRTQQCKKPLEESSLKMPLARVFPPLVYHSSAGVTLGLHNMSKNVLSSQNQHAQYAWCRELLELQ